MKNDFRRDPSSPTRCKICGCGELEKDDWDEHSDKRICKLNLTRRLINVNAELEKLELKKKVK